jgi:WD40 repeat protein
MKVQIQCPACGEIVSGPEKLLGRTLLCSTCRQPFVAKYVPPTVLDAQDAADVATVDFQAPGAKVESLQNQNEKSPGLGRIGRFELRVVLGQGTFGRVYQAYDPLLDRWVALKVPKFSSDQRDQVERFLGEAKAAGRLKHPNIVAVFETGQAGEDYFIASEFVEGKPLSKRLAEKRPTPERAAQWIRDLALALVYAHNEGIVHRDIKPANIMIGKHDRPQVMDFGLAKRQFAELGGEVHISGQVGLQDLPRTWPNYATVEGAVLGTPAYMSPEQARGDIKAVGPASDQYGLGVVLYEMLTGQLPFQGSPRDVLEMVKTRKPPSPHRLDSNIPQDLSAICMKALEKDPADRYTDAGELAADLQRWLRGESTRVRPISPVERFRRWYQRHRPFLIAGGLTTFALSGVIVLAVLFLNYRAQVAKERAEDAEVSRKKNADAEALLQIVDEKQRKSLRTQAELCRQRGLLLCHEKKVREGMLFFAKALVIASEIHGEDLDTALGSDLWEWSEKIAPMEGEQNHPGTNWRRAAVQLVDLHFPFGHPMYGGPATNDDQVAQSDNHQPVTKVGLSLRHESKILGGAFVEDGRAFLTIANKSSQRWTLFDGKPLGSPRKYNWPDDIKAIDSNHGRILTGNRGATITAYRLRDAATGESLGPEFQYQGTGALLSPNGQTVVVYHNDIAQLWDGITGHPIKQSPMRDLHIFKWAFSPDEFLDCDGAGSTQVWDLTTGQAIGPRFHISLNENQKTSILALSLDATTLLVFDGRKIALMDPAKGQLKGELKSPPQGVKDMAFSPDGKKALICAGDKVFHWDLATREVLGEHTQMGVLRAAFSPDGQRLLAWGDNAARLYDAASGRYLSSPMQAPSSLRQTLFSPNGRLILTIHDHEVRLWPTPIPPANRVRGITLWVQILTGMELDSAERLVVLSPSEREERRVQFHELIGMDFPSF